MGPEHARLDVDTLASEGQDERLDQRPGDLRPRRIREAGSSSLLALAVCEERELADDERLAADVEERAVEPAVVVREDPQAGDLGGEARGRLGRVLVPCTDKHEKARPARTDDLAVDTHGGSRDPLDDGAHGSILYARPVGVVELMDRDVIASFLRRRPAAHAYALGDLDDFFWPHTQWLAWDDAGGIAQIALLYDEPDPPVLLALAEPPDASMRDLLAGIAPDLPASVYAHLSPGLVDVLGPRLVPATPPVEHRKLGLVDRTRLLERVDGHVDFLGPEDVEEIVAFYGRAYPGTWFEPRMLETRRYVGVREGGSLVCVAGVHVWSPTWRVAALGNVATLPEARGRGLATAACAHLCRLLLDDGIETIALNVRADNVAALRSYERLGFAQAADYVEVLLSAKTVG